MTKVNEAGGGGAPQRGGGSGGTQPEKGGGGGGTGAPPLEQVKEPGSLKAECQDLDEAEKFVDTVCTGVVDAGFELGWVWGKIYERCRGIQCPS